MHILVTRPRQDASALESALQALGHTVIVEPMIEIALCDVSQVLLAGLQGVIATSRNGLRAIARHPAIDQLKALPLFVVGSGTAQEAADIGFARIMTGSGTARSLPDLIAGTADPAAGRLLYLAGDHLATDLAGALVKHGFQVETHAAYASRQVSELSRELMEAIVAKKLHGVILMSPRTAMTFVDLVRAQGLADMARRLQFFCLSPAVARELDRLSSKPDELAVFISARPDREELLVLLRP